jgi:hypothetical protein
MGKDFVLGTRSHAGAEEFLIKGTGDQPLLPKLGETASGSD